MSFISIPRMHPDSYLVSWCFYFDALSIQLDIAAEVDPQSLRVSDLPKAIRAFERC